MSKLITALRRRGEGGMTTAEYATGTVAACGVAGALYKLAESESVQNWISGLFEKAFSFFL